MILWHDDNPPVTPANIRRAIHRVGLRQYPDLFTVKRADAMGKNPSQQADMLAYIDDYEAQYRQIIEEEQCISLKELAVDGSDLIAAGMKPGKNIGETLDYLLRRVLENPEYNNRETLLKLAAERLA